jgi:hypothetical protein
VAVAIARQQVDLGVLAGGDGLADKDGLHACVRIPDELPGF